MMRQLFYRKYFVINYLDCNPRHRSNGRHIYRIIRPRPRPIWQFNGDAKLFQTLSANNDLKCCIIISVKTNTNKSRQIENKFSLDRRECLAGSKKIFRSGGENVVDLMGIGSDESPPVKLSPAISTPD